MNRHHFLRTFAVLALMGLAAVACGGSDEPTVADSGATTSSTTSLPSVTLPEPDRAIEPLTGRDLTDESLLDRPAFATKIDNDDLARPQDGISRADVIFELLIENSTSRFLAVFHSDVPDETGPTRSARSSDIDILAALGTPVFAFAGSNPGVATELRSAEAEGVMVSINVDSVGPPSSFRDPDRTGAAGAPHNLIAVPSETIVTAGGEPGSPDPILAYRAPDEVGEAGPGGGIELTIGQRNRAVFLWGGGLDGWGRYQNDSAQVDSEGTHVAPANVVVLEVEYGTSVADRASPQARTVGTGAAVVARNGEIVEGTWTRGADADPFQLTDASGDLILLDPGQTWIGLARPSDYKVLSPEDAVLRALALTAAEG
ncbi:MAG: DUF3048 domain-containing protein [Acidimicrobiia bacterium]|nr:DUF3048 domain-containing protein [Acidimicrobiia bacterium]MDH5237916.1 DUF3048 domain-containing protein [Acidimicrobiia bacterium]